MKSTILALAIVVLAAVNGPAAENPIFQELTAKGVKMSDGSVRKLPRPILADGLDAAGQREAIGKVADARSSFEQLVAESYYAPVVVKVRTIKASEDEGPALRAVDVWFVVRGDWDTLNSKDFLDSAIKGKDEGKSRVVLTSGVLDKNELAQRKLSVTAKDGVEEQFVYTTFVLFDRVEISATRFALVTRSKDSILAAGRIDPRFAKDAEFPNQWRPLLRDERAEISRGPAHPLAHAGGYAKITRLVEPADAMLIECHMVYEEPYAWFDGANLVKQKVPAMVQEKVKTFRRKLATASAGKKEKSSKADQQ
jgi:hypothetical protein